MARFRFKVSDPAGKMRAGHVSATDLAAARRQLQAGGYSVHELGPASGTGLVVSGPLGSGRNDPLRPKPKGAAYKPGVIEFLEGVESDPRRRWGTLLGLVVLGLLLSLLHGRGPSLGPGAQAAPSPSFQEVALVLSGHVEVPLELRGKTTLQFSLPEVPLTLIRDYGQVVGDTGDYRFEYNCEARQQPSAFSVSLRIDGKESDSAENLPLSGTPLTGTAPSLAARRP